ncbi:MAG TPA: hypothetical protein VN047_18630 [Sphingopyxis sp.]|uniref:hypothetical protein n=1 Tax=Sphingopyxis sp. TaxID=1908224 RepID=UPI002C26AC64|nr:hypothetical protein [Sphingopyxis sp.]HWW58916.1 hypothetical protein [Sphingopyxis sp.]
MNDVMIEGLAVSGFVPAIRIATIALPCQRSFVRSGTGIRRSVPAGVCFERACDTAGHEHHRVGSKLFLVAGMKAHGSKAAGAACMELRARLKGSIGSGVTLEIVGQPATVVLVLKEL